MQFFNFFFLNLIVLTDRVVTYVWLQTCNYIFSCQIQLSYLHRISKQVFLFYFIFFYFISVNNASKKNLVIPFPQGEEEEGGAVNS